MDILPNIYKICKTPLYIDRYLGSHINYDYNINYDDNIKSVLGHNLDACMRIEFNVIYNIMKLGNYMARLRLVDR